MGDVYFAQHPRLPRREARFVREAYVAGPPGHQNIMRVSDRGEFNRQPCISMDLIDGTDAATPQRDRYSVGVPADPVTVMIAAIASARDYAHQHRALMPNFCVRSGRACPAGDYTWGVHYPKLVR